MTYFFKFRIQIFSSSHLHYTGHIGDFIIASEIAIAKGIRRIVALTGPEATKALRKADVLQKRLEKLDADVKINTNTFDSKECVRKIVELTDDISHATIPCWRKANYFFYLLFYFLLFFLNFE